MLKIFKGMENRNSQPNGAKISILTNMRELLRGQPLRQLIRYGVVGLAQNSVGYCVYLFFTWLGADPKLVVAISYPAAMLVSFLGNKKYTFDFKGAIAGSGFRFILAHCASYAINLLLLYICVDILGYPHQIVQAAAIFICAAFLFFALKFFVFRQTRVTRQEAGIV